MYNLKIKDYGNGQVQTRLYSHLIYTGDKATSKSTIEFIKNPFDNTLAPVISDLDKADRDAERSLSVSLKRSKNNIYDLSRSNIFDWFVTLTLDPVKVDRYDYNKSAKKVSEWLHNMKHICSSDFKYLVVPELHKDGAYHFHGLFANCSELLFTFSGHYDSKHREIYNIGKYHFGFTTATKVGCNEAATKYLTKYCTKDLFKNTKGRKKYWNSKNLNRPLETVSIVEPYERTILHNELIHNDIKYFKKLDYSIGISHRSVCYYEHIDNLKTGVE